MNMKRRDFLTTSTAAVGAAALGLTGHPTSVHAGKNTAKIKKAVKYQMIREKLSVVDKFKLLQDLGYDGVEIGTGEKINHKEAVKARETTGLPIHGVINAANPDIKSAIDLSRQYGGTSVLVVAGRVGKETGYDKNYEEWQQRIRDAVEHAEKQKIHLLVENVWNNFLLSPLEMARFIDEIDSPWVGVYFDVGNVVRFGWPDQWIRILGSRIGKLDIKEYSRAKQRNEGLWKGFEVEIGEGDCDWPEVRKELAAIKFTGWATAEVRGGNRERLKEIAERMDRVLEL